MPPVEPDAYDVSTHNGRQRAARFATAIYEAGTTDVACRHQAGEERELQAYELILAG